MNSLFSGIDFLAILSGVLATSTAFVTLVAGVEQLSASSRARQTLEWTLQSIDAEVDHARIQILRRLILSNQAYLLSTSYVPFWKFGELALFMLLSPLIIFLGSTAGYNLLTLVLLGFGGIAALGLTIRPAIRLYAVRKCIELQFIEGRNDVEPVDLGPAGLMEGRVRKEFLIAFVSAISVIGTAASVSWFLGATTSTAPLHFFVLGVGGCIVSLQWIKRYAVRWAKSRIHP